MGITKNTDTAQQKLDSDNIQHEKNNILIFGSSPHSVGFRTKENREAFRNATHGFGSQDE
jgi:hypothetical protein